MCYKCGDVFIYFSSQTHQTEQIELLVAERRCSATDEAGTTENSCIEAGMHAMQR